MHAHEVSGGPTQHRPSAHRKILVIDDQAMRGNELIAQMRGFGYEVELAMGADSARDACERFQPDLAIVDIDMMQPASLRLGMQLTDIEKLPFIVYSESYDVSHRVVALQLGADNYLLRPMESRLLQAHLGAILRRLENTRGVDPLEAGEKFGPYFIDPIARRIRYNNFNVRLSGTEFEIFWLLARRFGKIVSRREMSDALTLSKDDRVSRAVEQRIFRLRARLVSAGAPRDAIKSVRGKGYVLTGASVRLQS